MVGGGSPAGAVNARAQEAMQFFMSKGYSREQAAGLVANLARESSTFDPRAVGDSGKARGIAQWHPDRQADFKAWSGKDIGVASFQEQLGFVDYELTKGKKGKVGALLKQTTSAREAAALVSRRYEIPANADREAALRGAMAENYYRTPLPDTGAEGRPGEQRVVVEMAPGEFVLKDQRGQQLAQTQVQAAGRVAKPQPAGM
ncbi:phage tail tip lysozyme [Bradyrhizobium sp. USDA 3364]